MLYTTPMKLDTISSFHAPIASVVPSQLLGDGVHSGRVGALIGRWLPVGPVVGRGVCAQHVHPPMPSPVAARPGWRRGRRPVRPWSKTSTDACGGGARGRGWLRCKP